MNSPEELMAAAIEAAKQGVLAGQSPFGCAIARQGTLLAVCHNTVWADTDITAHAEMNAIRQACRKTGEVLLEGCVVATTCEPCPMCAAALHWARVSTVYFGATIADAADAGFQELHVPAQQLLRQGGSATQLIGSVEREACRAVFDLWLQQPDRRAY